MPAGGGRTPPPSSAGGRTSQGVRKSASRGPSTFDRSPSHLEFFLSPIFLSCATK